MKMDNLHFPKINELINDVTTYADEVLGEVDVSHQKIDELILINIRRLNGTFTMMQVHSLREFALSLSQEFHLHKLDPRLLTQEVYFAGFYDIGTGAIEAIDGDDKANFIGTFAGIIKLTADKQLNIL